MLGNNGVPFYEAEEEADTKKLLVIGVVIAATIGVGIAIASQLGWGQSSSFEIDTSHDTPLSSSPDNQNVPQTTCIYVHVLGCVQQPGVYTLPEGARICDAVAAAGGLTADAAEDSVNMASVLKDGTQVKILSKGELEESQSSAGGSTAVSSAAGSVSGNSQSKININTATQEQLQTLSGIGASTAQKIIAYREANGPFGSIEELTEVSGIGDKKYEAIKDSITV